MPGPEREDRLAIGSGGEAVSLAQLGAKGAVIVDLAIEDNNVAS